MRHLATSRWITVCLLACLAGCFHATAEKVATVVQQTAIESPLGRSIRIAVDGLDSCRIDEGQPVTLAGLPVAVQERMGQIEPASAKPAHFTIRIRVDDAVPYSSFAQVVTACRETSFFRFEVVVAELAFPFDMTPLDPKTEVDDLRLPPLKVRLQANEMGELAALTLNDRELDDLAELQQELIGVIGDDRGPGSIQEVCEIEFDCDDNLQFSHLAAAYLAVSGYKAEDGSRVVLVEKLWPMMSPLSEMNPAVVIEIESRIDLEAVVIPLPKYEQSQRGVVPLTTSALDESN